MFLIFQDSIWLESHQCRNGHHQGAGGQQAFKSLLEAKSIWKSLPTWASNASARTFLRSTSKITYSTTIFRTNWTPLCPLRSILYSVLSSDSSIMVKNSFATKVLNGVFPFSWDHVSCTSAVTLRQTIFVLDIRLIIGSRCYFTWPQLAPVVQHRIPWPFQYIIFYSIFPSETRGPGSCSCWFPELSSANSCPGTTEYINSCRKSSAGFGRQLEIAIIFAGRRLG